LDKIEGIGPKTVELLITHFGSVKKVMEAKKEELIQLIGKSKTALILKYKREE
jgi:excinuclease ABC subunit C